MHKPHLEGSMRKEVSFWAKREAINQQKFHILLQQSQIFSEFYYSTLQQIAPRSPVSGSPSILIVFPLLAFLHLSPFPFILNDSTLFYCTIHLFRTRRALRLSSKKIYLLSPLSESTPTQPEVLSAAQFLSTSLAVSLFFLKLPSADIQPRWFSPF